MYLDNLKARVGLLEQHVELGLAPLLSAQRHQHAEVDLSQMMFLILGYRVAVRKHHIVDEKRRGTAAGFQSGNEGTEDLDRVRVVVVVQALAEQKSRRVVDGLRGEEVVLLEGNTAAKIPLGLR